MGLGEEVEVITVDGEPVFPAVPHPKCVAVGICPGFCLGKSH